MKRVISLAKTIAAHNVPGLIEGESETGKELLARAIHEASPRRDKPFKALNCGAIPPELVEGTLFGTKKGFATSVGENKGFFESCHGGTLLLDEVGELSAAEQVKLLRALQEKEIVRVGATIPRKVNVRIIAATNRTIGKLVEQGRLREDLFYRMAVAVIKIPPLRERPGDLNLLIDGLMKEVNDELAIVHAYRHKRLSPGARNLLLNYSWPGNVRELLNTLYRAAIWSDASIIELRDIEQSILPAGRTHAVDILDRPLHSGFSLPEVLRTVAQHYMNRALDKTGENKTRAAEILGLASYQTLSNWMKKYDIKR
jgi:transcriptional regulator with PAS, ATPase and Fis domain